MTVMRSRVVLLVGMTRTGLIVHKEKHKSALSGKILLKY